MSANDGDLVDRMAKKYSVSPAAVQAVLAALRSGGGRMPSSAMPISGECRSGRRACRWLVTCSTRNSRPSWGRRSATVHRPGRRIGGQPDWGGWARSVRRTISDMRSFPEPAAADRRSRYLSVYGYGIPSDFQYRAGPKCRSDAHIHEPGRARENCGPSKGLRLIGFPVPSIVPRPNFVTFRSSIATTRRLWLRQILFHPNTDLPSNSGDAVRSVAT